MDDTTSTLIIFGGMLLFLVAGIGLYVVVKRRRAKQLQDWETFAWQNGWSFRPDDPNVLAHLSRLLVPAEGTLRAVMERRYSDARVYLFQIDRTNDIFQAEDQEHSGSSESGILFEHSDLDLPPFLIMSIGTVPSVVQSLWSFVLPDFPRVEWDDLSEFGEKYWVLTTAEAETAVRDFLTYDLRRDLLRWLEQYPPLNKFMVVVQGQERLLAVHNPSLVLKKEQLASFERQATAVYDIFAPDSIW